MNNNNDSPAYLYGVSLYLIIIQLCIILIFQVLFNVILSINGDVRSYQHVRFLNATLASMPPLLLLVDMRQYSRTSAIIKGLKDSAHLINMPL